MCVSFKYRLLFHRILLSQFMVYFDRKIRDLLSVGAVGQLGRDCIEVVKAMVLVTFNDVFLLFQA